MSLLTCRIWDLSAPVSPCLCEHLACAFQLMTGNGGLPHSKPNTKKCRAGQMKGKNVWKNVEQESLGGGLGTLGGDCPLYWKFLPGFGGWAENLLWLGSGFLFCLHLFCPSLHLQCQSVSYLWICPRILFLLPPFCSLPSSQSND